MGGLTEFKKRQGVGMPDNTHEVDHWPGHPISYTTTHLKMFFNEQFLATGTAFIMKYAGKYGLVTNWHVVSGRNPITGKCLSSNGGIPNMAKCHVALVHRLDDGPRFTETIHFLPVEIPLIDEEGRAIWSDNRANDPLSDYVIILLDKLIPELDQPRHSLRAIQAGVVTIKRGKKATNKVKPEDVNHFYPQVGHQVFIVGYPVGVEHSGVFPIWKGGTIASEPTSSLSLAGVETDDVIYVDGLTRAGMSGSPVICLQKPGDSYFTDDGVKITVSKAEPLLVGVYAGRDGVTNSEADLALGRVWKVAALERLFGESITGARSSQVNT